MEALRYDFRPLKSHSKVGSVVTLEMKDDDCLYVVPSVTHDPKPRSSKQPKGFPICPKRRVDLV